MKRAPEDLRTAGAHRGVGHMDYRETADVTESHAAVAREHAEPAFGTVPIPLWLMAVSGVAVFWAGAYLGMFSGGFSSDVYNELSGAPKTTASAQQGGAPGEAAKGPSAADEGKRYFTQNCVSCHQATGLGVPGQYPPLAKSEFVNGGSQRLAMILLKGLIGPVKVSGTQYNGAMPAWEKTLTDKKIAAILTYIRQEWGNQAPEVTVEHMTAARKELAGRSESFTEADILAVPADSYIKGGAPAPAEKK
ncbi:MAG: hypothetical protein QOD99_2667 [Chthoniobacter sp.]|jgi:mono/diheme cytochrome c family protein|nr:hypothetical protein [Chthoniobacter sp.]